MLALNFAYKVFIIYFIINLADLFSSAYAEKKPKASVCIYAENCEKCLQADPNCAWCSDVSFGTIQPRCRDRKSLLADNCSEDSITENSSSNKIIENDESENNNKSNGGTSGIPNQFPNRKYKIKLFKYHTEQIRLTYRPVENYPLDLYYLMDMTWSMRDDKETLSNVSANLAKELSKLTNNHRVGFGSFADKPVFPVTMIKKEINPCRVLGTTCEPTYAFRHHLSLTKNINEFIEKVQNSKITANVDNMEGGLDALMQVIVCDEQIGWNPNARKIVILATDGLCHFAGDGLLLGILKKNDKKCHLDKNGIFIDALEYDYPSLEEVYRELLRRKIMVIFAVTSNVEQVYKEMSALMNDFSSVEILHSDSSNILELVSKGYQYFAKKVQFFDNSPDFLHVTYEIDCGDKKVKQKNRCDNVEIGKDIHININITLTEYPSGFKNFTLKIEESLISQQTEIEVELQSPCPCLDTEKPVAFYEERRINTEFCNNHGRFRCGMCFCDEDWIGKTCACNSNSYTNIQALENLCKRADIDNRYVGPVCSDKGECVCGQCICNSGYSGKYCECDECEDCNPARGNCVCGMCVCRQGWTGDNCDCPVSQKTCMSPNLNGICSGHGTCDCGVCSCKESYYGKFCEVHPSADNQVCRYYEECVICLIRDYQNVRKCENVSAACIGEQNTTLSYNFVSHISDSKIKCIIRLTTENNEKCDHAFTYDMNTKTETHLIIEVARCIRIDYAKLGFGFFIFTIVIGLIIFIVLKIIFTIRDRNDYEKFQREHEQCTEFKMQSPIYKSPITSYEVPRMDDD